MFTLERNKCSMTVSFKKKHLLINFVLVNISHLAKYCLENEGENDRDPAPGKYFFRSVHLNFECCTVDLNYHN